MNWELILSGIVLTLSIFALIWAGSFIHDFYVLQHNFKHLNERVRDIERDGMEKEEVKP